MLLALIQGIVIDTHITSYIVLQIINTNMMSWHWKMEYSTQSLVKLLELMSFIMVLQQVFPTALGQNILQEDLFSLKTTLMTEDATKRTMKGTIAVEYNNIFGYICDDVDFDDFDVAVLCKQLGYTGDGSMNYHASPVRDHIWLSGLQCGGYEDHILDCPYQVPNSSACAYAANINCKDLPEEGGTSIYVYGVMGIFGAVVIFALVGNRQKVNAILRENRICHAISNLNRNRTPPPRGRNTHVTHTTSDATVSRPGMTATSPSDIVTTGTLDNAPPPYPTEPSETATAPPYSTVQSDRYYPPPPTISSTIPPSDIPPSDIPPSDIPPSSAVDGFPPPPSYDSIYGNK